MISNYDKSLFFFFLIELNTLTQQVYQWSVDSISKQEQVCLLYECSGENRKT